VLRNPMSEMFVTLASIESTRHQQIESMAKNVVEFSSARSVPTRDDRKRNARRQGATAKIFACSTLGVSPPASPKDRAWGVQRPALSPINRLQIDKKPR
jgi:hypothetical protein